MMLDQVVGELLDGLLYDFQISPLIQAETPAICLFIGSEPFDPHSLPPESAEPVVHDKYHRLHSRLSSPQQSDDRYQNAFIPSNSTPDRVTRPSPDVVIKSRL